MIYDCFTYNGECDLLKIRCEELKGLDVTHVLVESPWTFTGKPKDLKFPEVMSKFNDYNILYIVVEDMPNNGNAWDNERWQRNAITRGIDNAKPDDLVIISDCDEIPNHHAILYYLANGWKESCALRMDMYSYYLNCLQGKGTWDMARIVRKSILDKATPDEIRNAGFQHSINIGGWHFTYQGGVNKIREKLESFSHTEVNTPLLNNEEVLKYKLEHGQSLWSSEPDDLWEFVQIDHTFPQYLQENISQLQHMIKS